MGNSGSSKVEEQKNEQSIQLVIQCLNTHRDNVFGIAHAIEAQHAHVQLLSKNIGDIVSENDGITKDDQEEAVKICDHCSKDWQRNTKKLLGSIQTGLRCQSNSLQSSFKRATKCINKILDYYRIDIASSDEKEMKFWVDYEDSPQLDYEQKYRELEQNHRHFENKSITQIEELTKKIKTHKQNEETYKLEYEELSRCHKKEMKESEEKSKQAEKQCEALRSKIKTLENRKIETDNSLHSTESLVVSLKADKEHLENKIKALKRKIPLQLYFSVKGDTMPKLLDELKAMLATQLNVERHELQFVIIQNEKDVDPEIPLLVLCINASRLGTDASSALQNLNLNVSSNVSVLIFHHKDVHALPSQASERVLTGPEFKDLGGIFDIAFLAERGIYPCDMNRAAAAGIDQFLKNCK